MNPGSAWLLSWLVAYPERLLSPGEDIIRQFRPHWRVLLVPLVLLLVVVAAIIVLNLQVSGTGAVVGTVGLVAVWILVSVRSFLDWLTTAYVITNERVVFRAGVLSRRGVEIPLESITNVAFSQTLFERLLRSGDLLIESAGRQGQSRYRDIPDPEGLQSLIYQAREARTVSLQNSKRSVAAELESLARLRDQGVLSEDEFLEQKRRLLGAEGGE